jgi:hypothetical protein
MGDKMKTRRQNISNGKPANRGRSAQPRSGDQVRAHQPHDCKALGVRISDNLLSLADKVIE